MAVSARPPHHDLSEKLELAGFYPHLISDLLSQELDGAPALHHLLHLETHVERAEVHRHATILVLTRDELVILHVDDHQPEDTGRPQANVSVETVALPRVDSVVVSSVYADPHEHRAGTGPRELTLGIAWSGGARLDLGPAGCGDQQCQVDHGYTGQTVREDLVLRVSADAEGPVRLQEANDFARVLRRAGSEAAWAGHEVPVAGDHVGPRRSGARLVRGSHH